MRDFSRGPGGSAPAPKGNQVEKTSTAVVARQRQWETHGYGHSGSKDEPFRYSAGQVLLNGRPVLPDENLKAPRSFETLFEDGDVLVRKHYGAGCLPLHRLGRGTSGTLLFTRNARTARLLTIAMKERRIRKVYLALASGTAMPDSLW